MRSKLTKEAHYLHYKALVNLTFVNISNVLNANTIEDLSYESHRNISYLNHYENDS